MRALMIALAASAVLVATAARAHGPQIQITRDDNRITTRRLLREEPYSTRLTRPTTVYAIPLLETQGIWYSRPNNTASATLPGLPEYLSGPGIAYGNDQMDGGSRSFASGQHFELKLIDGLKWWDGSTFVNPGTEQIEAFRSTATPAVTSDSLTPASPATLAYGNVSATYNATAHSGASFRLLGDGTSPTVEGDDGIYLLSMNYASTEPGLNASEPFYFVLHKNALPSDIASAVGSLGFPSPSVQYVPEPSCAAMLAVGLGICSRACGGQRRKEAITMIRPRRGMTLVELLVVMAIIGVLVAMLLPAIQAARAAARATSCKNNMRQIGLAILQYCDSHKGQFPEWSHSGANKSWIYTVADHLEKVDEIRLCPEDFLLVERRYMKSTSYVLNDYLVVKDTPGAVRNHNKLQATSRTMVAMEGADRRKLDPLKGDPHEYNAAKDEYVYAHSKYDHAHASQWFSKLNRDWGLVATAVKNDIQLDRHLHTSHYLYADGHVETIAAGQIEEWIDTEFEFARPE